MLLSHYAANVLRRLWICEYCLGSGVKGPPTTLFKQFKVYGTWQLVSPKSFLCTAKKNPKQNKKVIKTMAKHFYRHTRQPMVHLKKIKNYNKTARCWNPLSSLSAAWNRKPLKIKIKNMTETLTLFKSLLRYLLLFYRLSTVSKLALVN